ncbi:hypothetical protein JZ751_000043, partial [Albula glossodonta]
MGRIAKETTGQVFSFIGFVGVALTCGLPMWRVTTFIGPNITTGQIVWDGLWMNCVMQSTGQMQCNIHQFLLRLSRDLQAARALVVSSVVFAFVGVALSFLGAKCTSCFKKDASMAKMVIFSGVLCIVGAILVLIPVCWSAAVTVMDFQSAIIIDTQKRELGAAIYIGWVSALLLIIGGSILCSSCPPSDNKYKYYPPTAYTYPYPYAGSVVTPGPYIPVKPTYMAPSAAPTNRSQYTPPHDGRHFEGDLRKPSKMVHKGRQALGFFLAGLGSLGVVVICALPMWKVTAFIGANIVTSQVFWEGLWMNCVLQSTGHMQCKAYDSLLALPQDLQAARALVVISIAVSVAAAMVGVAGGRCTNFYRRDQATKAKVAIVSGVVFIAAGVLCLIPVCWSASTLITGFYNPLVPTGQKGELGAALYVGWMAGALLILGGALLS